MDKEAEGQMEKEKINAFKIIVLSFHLLDKKNPYSSLVKCAYCHWGGHQGRYVPHGKDCCLVVVFICAVYSPSAHYLP